MIPAISCVYPGVRTTKDPISLCDICSKNSFLPVTGYIKKMHALRNLSHHLKEYIPVSLHPGQIHQSNIITRCQLYLLSPALMIKTSDTVVFSGLLWLTGEGKLYTQGVQKSSSVQLDLSQATKRVL